MADLTNKKRRRTAQRNSVLKLMKRFDELIISETLNNDEKEEINSLRNTIKDKEIIIKDIDNFILDSLPVPTDLSSEWVAVIDRLNQLGYLSINRCYMTTMLTDPFVIYELHGFSDASLKAYGACVYLRGITRSGLVKTCLVSSKSRVAPRKVLTIPRLELLGNLILARLVVSIAPVLRKEFYLNEIFYWTDSMITLAWIKSLDKEYKTFVENRVQEIRKLTDSNKWKYCCTTENPADIITRQDISLTSCQKQLWWEGPEHLKLLNDQWAEISCNLHGDQLIMSENEEKSHVVTLTSREQTDVSIANTISIENYSNIRKLYRVTAWVKRFINNVRSSLSRCVVNASQVLSCEEMSKAENAWIMENQRHLNKSSRYHQLESELNVFNDDCGIIRCKGRLSQAPIPDSAKFPVLLARNHRLAELIVIRTHIMLKHSGVKQTLTEIRQKYWIPKGRSYIRKLLFNCVTCRRLQGKHYDYPTIPSLTPLRLSDIRPFFTIGIDNFGPLYVKNVFHTDYEMPFKVWATLFTCAASRGITLDIVPDPSSDSIIRCLSRFISRRGCPNHVIPDNGSNFAANKTQNFATERNIEWHFNLQLAPWYGGFFERVIRIVKSYLKKDLKNSRLTFEQLQTVLLEIEQIVNNRPLTYVYPNELEPCLTPNHLLYGHRLEQRAIQNGNDWDKTVDLNSYCEEVEQVLCHFWDRWRKEYLGELREQHKIDRKKLKLTVHKGDVVIIHEDFVPRALWKMGVILDVLPSKDGCVRGAVVKVGKTGTIINRPVTKLYPLEYFKLSANNPTQNSTADIREETINEVPDRRRREASVLGEIRRRWNVDPNIHGGV